MTTEAETIAELARQTAHGPTNFTTEAGRHFLIVPGEMRYTDVSEPNSVPKILPDHIMQGVTLQTTDSLIAYANRFKNADTMLFASITNNTIRAILDYHEAPAGPKHSDHQAALTLPLSEEWRLWTGIDKKLMPQLDFARFIEENADDIASPDGATILETMRDLQAKRKVNFTKAVRTNTDNESFEYSDETSVTTKGGIDVPTRFLLSIPIYFGEPPTMIGAFLRWKLDDGQLLLGISLNRAELVRQAAFRLIVEGIVSKTDLPAVFGTAG